MPRPVVIDIVIYTLASTVAFVSAQMLYVRWSIADWPPALQNAYLGWTAAVPVAVWMLLIVAGTTAFASRFFVRRLQ